MEMSDQFHTSSALTPREGAHNTLRIGGQVGPKDCLNILKIRQICSLFRQSNHGSLVVHPVA